MSNQEGALAAQEQSFSAALAEIAAKDQRRHRIAQVLTIGMVAAAGCWLAFSVLQVRQLNRQKEELQAANERIKSEIGAETKILVVLHPFLQRFGWAPNKIPKQIGDVDQIGRSLEANEELNKLRATSHPPTAGNVVVEYYPKDLDGDKVRSALNDFGFHVVEKRPVVEDVPANDVVFGEKITPESAKIVAYVLMRAGVDIKGIYRSRLISNSNVIQVIGNRIAANGPPLTVENIRQMSSFAPDPIY